MDLLVKSHHQIETGEVRVLFLDECHLLWGNICGYVWGQRQERVEVPVKSHKTRQTYYGAFDYHSKQFTLSQSFQANSQSTIEFLNFLRSQFEDSRLYIIWDGVSYHRSLEIRNYLASVNQNLPPEQWQITLYRLAPYAPEQNPVEDIWLQAKNFVRQFYMLCKSFSAVKFLFEFAVNHQVFSFDKVFMYG
jgi:transposase